MHSRGDLNCTRGYEFWLMREAKRRNPSVVTWGLPWGAPGWINNQTGYYGPDLITYQVTTHMQMRSQLAIVVFRDIMYQVNWLKCARDYHQVRMHRIVANPEPRAIIIVTARIRPYS